MMQALAILAAAAWWLLERIGIRPSDPRAVRLGGRLFMPLFYLDLRNKIASTWNYLAKELTEQQHCRARIKALCANGETPAITFLVTTGEGGNLWLSFPGVLNEPAVDAAASAMRELCADGIAVIPCLYVDDPSGSMPRWWEIASHRDGLKQLHERIGRYVSGYLVSIEQNERARDVYQIEDAIEAMQSAMPGAQVYGTHLQWTGGGSYRWQGGRSTPANAGIIVAEASWQPQQGDSRGVDGVRRDIDAMAGNVDMSKIVYQEFNINPTSETNAKQREFLRSRAMWGQG